LVKEVCIFDYLAEHNAILAGALAGRQTEKKRELSMKGYMHMHKSALKMQNIQYIL